MFICHCRVTYFTVICISLCVLCYGKPQLSAADSAAKLSRVVGDSTIDHPALTDIPVDNDLATWLQTGDLASLIGVAPKTNFVVSIPLKLIFLGFDGDGNKLINVSEDKLSPWFEHVEHYMPHLILPLPNEKVHSNAKETGVEYKYHYEVLKLSQHVNAYIENAISKSLRAEESYSNGNINKTVSFYVNPRIVTDILSSVISQLELEDSYVLFLLNPTIPTKVRDVNGIYGYRRGFDKKTLESFQSETNGEHMASITNLLFDKLRRIHDKRTSSNESDVVSASTPDPKRPRGRLRTADEIMAQSTRWSSTALETSLDDKPSENIKSAIQSAIKTHDEKHETFLETYSFLRPILDNNAMTEECNVDLWVGPGRFAFIDLSAGPFEWGAIVDGEGVRSRATLPVVPGSISEDDMWGNEEQRAEPMPESYEFQDLMKMEQKELDELFSQNECLMDTFRRKKICQDLKTVMRYVSESISETSSNRGGVIMKKGVNVETTPDGFLAQLSATVHTTLHHLISPTSAHLPEFFPDRIFFHVFIISIDDSDQKSFTTYFGEYKREMLKLKLPHQEFAFSLHKLTMKNDIELAMAYSNSIRSAVVPTFDIVGNFTANKRFYLDSAELQHNLRVLHKDDEKGVSEKKKKGFKHFEQTWMTHQDHSSPLSHTIELPIFIFYLGIPLLIDKEHQSIALGDMVLAVRSKGSWQSQFSCNQNTRSVSLENPLKSLLMSTITLMSGILPSHLTYSDAHGRPMQDWLWSVGDNPLSQTSDGYHFARLHRDLVHRNYIIGVIAKVSSLFSEAVSSLSDIRLTKANFDLRNKIGIKSSVLSKSWDISSQIDSLSDLLLEMNYVEATTKLNKLLSAVIEFRESTRSLSEMFGLYRCVEVEESSSNGLLYFTLAIILAIGTILYSVTTNRTTSKPKIN